MVVHELSQRTEEVRHACTNHYKFTALMSLRSRDNVQAKCTELVVIRARMDLLWSEDRGGTTTSRAWTVECQLTCSKMLMVGVAVNMQTTPTVPLLLLIEIPT